MKQSLKEERTAWVRDAASRHEASLLRYAASLTRSAETAREVVQDAFLALCRQDPHELDGRLTEWLFTVVRNRSIDIRRKEVRMRTLSEQAAAACVDDRPPPSRRAELQDELARVERLMAGLSDNQQEVLRLKFQAGLSYQEIAGVTKLSVTNVGYLLHTALKELRGGMLNSEA